MSVLVVIESVVLVLLSVLVAGLLRAYATILRRLHELDGGAATAPPFRTVAGVAQPAGGAVVEGRAEWTSAHDVAGSGLDGETAVIRVVGVEHDTVLVFLSSGCTGCATFWAELAEPASVRLPAGSRTVVVTQDAVAESLSELRRLCPPDVDMVMSSQAWTDYAVPGSPFLAVVSGPSGRVTGEGSGQSLAQLAALIGQASGDGANPVGKPAADLARERDVDRALLAAGIAPGDPSLYGPG